MNEPTEEEIRAARSVLARRPTPARTDARRSNLAKARAARDVAPCTCDRPNGGHRVKCAAYRREMMQRWRHKQVENKPDYVDI